jgi:amino acid adenylation domain-containing protein
VLNFPADYPRPAVKSYNAKAVGISIDPELIKELKTSPLVRRTTLFVALAAILKVLLHRYTGQEDIIVGCPVAGRDRPDLDNQIGLYVNTLALRDSLNRGQSFAEILEGVKQTITEALEHQIYPFDKLVGELNLERDISRSPLFDLSINLNSADLRPTGLQFGDVAVSHLDQAFTMAKVDLSFDFTETPDGLQLSLIYSTDLFTEERIHNAARHFQQLAMACLREPGKPIGQLEMLSELERSQLIEQFNTTAADFARDKTIAAIFEDQVLKTPDHVAVAYQGEEVTYKELNRRANQLAHHLRSRGVGPEVMVGIFLERSPDLIGAVLGVLKAGGAYVPLEPTLPLERIAAILEDCFITIVVTQSNLEDKLPAVWATALCLDMEREELARESEDNPAATASPDNSAYVIYTSGSTGVPKAVVVEHRGLRNLSEVQSRLFGVQPGHRVLQFASLSFDASIFEISMALLAGATLCLGNLDALLPGEPLARFLLEERINVVTLPPSALAVLPTLNLADLGTILVAGEACPSELPSQWASGRRFFNLYGPTEATVWATQVLYGPGKQSPSIGRPIANVQIYLLDAGLQLVPVGIPGEICIGGVGLSRGYLNKPDLTAESFVPNPFGSSEGSRLYRTGDVARYLPDGNIEFLGRADSQVKIRGYRVELGEVEAVMEQHPQVLTAVVTARDDADSKRLAAYVLAVGDELDLQELRSYLRRKLPEYMVPAVISKVREFPLTVNGKIDRRALPDPDMVSIVAEEAFVAPRTDLESILSRLFAEVLGLERVGATHNFFELGGHSLLATQVVSRVREFFRIELPLSGFFQNSTVAQLAELLQNLEPNKNQVTKIARVMERLHSMPEEEKRELRAKKVRGQD